MSRSSCLLITVAAAASLALASSAHADPLSSVTLERQGTVMMGVEAGYLEGDRPAFVEEGRSFHQLTALYRARGGAVQENDDTELGTQVGIEEEVRLGYTARESDSDASRNPALFAFRLGVPLRALTFNTPLRTAVLAVLSTEVVFGGARWWAGGVRWNCQGGVRVATSLAEGVGFEAEYVLVPFTLTNTPGGVDVRRLEQHAIVTAGYRSFGIGAELLWARTFAQAGRGGERDTVYERGASLMLFWRVMPEG